MLRTIFVLVIAAFGFAYAFQGAFYALLLYIWVAYFRPETWVWGDLIASLNLSYFTGLFAVAAALLSGARWRFDFRIALLALMAVESLLSAVFGVRSGIALPLWVEFAKALLITYLIVLLVDDVKRVRLLLLIIGVSLGFEGAKQGWVGLLTHPGGLNTNGLPMVGDNNGVAVGMLMLVPILTTLAATTDAKLQRWFLRFLAFGVLYRAISTYSRGGLLACGALGLVYLARSPRRLAATTGIVIASILILPALPTEFWQRMGTITTPNQVGDDDRSALGRLHFWSVATQMANDNPLLGIGFNSYTAVYDQYDGTAGKFGQGRSVHSVWFGILAELGYGGLALFLLQLVLALRACSIARRASRAGPEYANLKKYAFAIEAALAAYIVGGTFLPFQYVEIYWHLIGLTIALEWIAKRAIADAQLRAAPPDPGVRRRLAFAS